MSSSANQFALLRQRRFAPFFWTQLLGAMNDNVFKFAFTVLVTYRLQVDWLPPALAGLVIGAVFILPYVLLSATSGQLADKLDKSTLMRAVKDLELAIMALGAVGLVQGWVGLLLLCIGLMGLHSTLFGPAKYAYLPQHLAEHELTGGNGMVEMGTFVAILLGNVLGGLLIALPADGWIGGTQAVAAASLILAALGRITAHFLPPSPSSEPDLRINWNPLSETWRNLRLAQAQPAVFRSLLGISWMWFFGAVFLAQFPSFAKDVVHGDEHVASVLLVVFSVGVGLGSLLCERLSHRHVEIGLVPLGAIGMSVFAADLYLASRSLPPVAQQDVSTFLAQTAHWRVLLDLFLLSLSAGLYSVPMYALIQVRSPASHRARIIAANNILNALFMIASSVLVGLLLSLGLSVPEVFGLTALANAVVATYIFFLVPEYLLRFIAWVMTHFVYRFARRGDEHIPLEGPAVLVCNHVSYMDAVLLMAASPRPIRFLMDHRIFAIPVLGAIFRLAKAIPVAPRSEDAVAYEHALQTAQAVLADGELLGIFPEGGLTPNGQLQPFKGGVMKVLEGHPVPVVPMALGQLWGSSFSRIDGRGLMSRPFRRGLWNRVTLTVAPARPAHSVTLESLHTDVAALLTTPPTP